MNREEIIKLCQDRYRARESELEAKRALLETESELEARTGKLLADAYDAGVIDGKNAETRKRQEQKVLAESDAVQANVQSIRILQEEADEAQIAREFHDDLLGLTKAWLYSLRGDA